MRPMDPEARLALIAAGLMTVAVGGVLVCTAAVALITCRRRRRG